MDDDEKDDSSLFTVYFPNKPPEDWTDILECEQRNFAVVGEAVDIVLVAQYRGSSEEEWEIALWRKELEYLRVSASVSTGMSYSDGNQISHSQTPTGSPTKIQHHCTPIASCQEMYNKQDPLQQEESSPKKKQEWITVDDTMLVYPMSVTVRDVFSLTLSCTVTIALWSSTLDSPGDDDCKYLQPFVAEKPHDIMNGNKKLIKQTVTGTLRVLNPPSLFCRPISPKGKHHLFLSVQNSCHNTVVFHDLQVIPYVQDEFLQMSPAARSKILENTDTERSSLDSSSFLKMNLASQTFPTTLQSQESHTIVLEYSVKEQIENQPDTEEIPVVAMVTWSRENNNSKELKHVVTQYRLPALRIKRPRLVITASCDAKDIKVKSIFNVKYTISNNLQDFLSLRLVWSPEKSLIDVKDRSEDYVRNVENVTKSVICLSPGSELGPSKKGTCVTVPVSFQVLKPGLFELGQHMKLNLKYSLNPLLPPGERRDSFGSTHSMPTELSPSVAMAGRNGTGTPVHNSLLKEGRRSSTLSSHSVPVGSPVRTPKRMLHGMESTIGAPREMSRVSQGNQSRLSPLREQAAGITPQQVMKRNFQVYVTE